MLPAVFLSHGAPTLVLTEAPARTFLQALGPSLGRPAAILAVSAHWETEHPAVTAVATNRTLHDFAGFPEELYRLTYPAPGSPALAQSVAEALAGAGLPCRIDRQRGLDHGVWVPLMLMYPSADVPVVQLSIQSHLGPEHHRQLGRAMRGLRAQDVLILASGSFTHNLSEFRHHRLDDPAPAWVDAFAAWFDAALADGRCADLLAYRRLAPFAARNHPTEEHLLPLFVALGAGSEPPRVERLHASVTHGVLRMDAYAFH